jgi:hypothetical protein
MIFHKKTWEHPANDGFISERTGSVPPTTYTHVSMVNGGQSKHSERNPLGPKFGDKHVQNNNNNNDDDNNSNSNNSNSNSNSNMFRGPCLKVVTNVMSPPLC